MTPIASLTRASKLVPHSSSSCWRILCSAFAAFNLDTWPLNTLESVESTRFRAAANWVSRCSMYRHVAKLDSLELTSRRFCLRSSELNGDLRGNGDSVDFVDSIASSTLSQPRVSKSKGHPKRRLRLPEIGEQRLDVK